MIDSHTAEVVPLQGCREITAHLERLWYGFLSIGGPLGRTDKAMMNRHPQSLELRILKRVGHIGVGQ